MSYNQNNPAECSKVLENALRYRAFSTYMSTGFLGAVSRLNKDCNSSFVKSKFSQKCIGRNQRGVEAELRFFDQFRESFILTPTLDAGCSFDFVGKIEDRRISPDNCFVRINVTTSLNAKREKDPITCRGQRHWPYRFAWIHAKSVTWHDETLGDALNKNTLSETQTSKSPYGLLCRSNKSSFAKVRREILEKVEFGSPLGGVLSIIDRLSDCKQKSQLVAQTVFFSTYKYALNIVPALSCGDLCDFIGEHDGELVRYRILTNTDGYYEYERPVIEKLSNTVKYMVALYDETARTFKFYDWDHWMLFNDMPNLDLPQS